MSSKITDVLMEDEDIVIGRSSNAADARFDLIIGNIEDIIMEPKFQKLQNGFMEKNYKHFEDTEENKLIYTTIHKDYINLIEAYLENELKKRIENFSMSVFMKDLISRHDELDGEIFEILMTFEDFLEFKQLMLSYKAAKEGKTIDFGSDLCIRSVNFDDRQTSSSASGRGNNNKKTPLLDNAHIDDINESDDE